jgi:hypothetical protein
VLGEPFDVRHQLAPLNRRSGHHQGHRRPLLREG